MGRPQFFSRLKSHIDRSLAFKLAAGACALAVLAFLSACSHNAEEAAQGPQSGSSIIMNGDGTKLYVANGDSNTVSVVEAASRKVLEEIPVGSEPRELALSSDGRARSRARRRRIWS